MGRGNAQERAARARARLSAVSEAQAEIAQQALDAVDAGIDPSIAASLAVAAANEIDIPREVTPVMQELERERARPAIQQASSEATRRIRVKGAFDGPSYVMVVYADNVAYEVFVDDNGEAVVNDTVAARLVKPTSDFEFVD